MGQSKARTIISIAYIASFASSAAVSTVALGLPNEIAICVLYSIVMAIISLEPLFAQRTDAIARFIETSIFKLSLSLVALGLLNGFTSSLAVKSLFSKPQTVLVVAACAVHLVSPSIILKLTFGRWKRRQLS